MTEQTGAVELHLSLYSSLTLLLTHIPSVIIHLLPSLMLSGLMQLQLIRRKSKLSVTKQRNSISSVLSEMIFGVYLQQYALEKAHMPIFHSQKCIQRPLNWDCNGMLLCEQEKRQNFNFPSSFCLDSYHEYHFINITYCLLSSVDCP